MLEMIAVILFLFLIPTTFWFYVKWRHSLWIRKGIYTIKFPRGIHFPYLTGYEILSEKGIKYGGGYRYLQPYLITTDLDFIRNVLIKDFDHFVDRDTFLNEKNDPMSATVENLRGETWKQMRSIMTPAFSSGKLKQMFPNIVHHSNSLIEVLNKYADADEPFNAKETIERFTMDAIGSTAFGIELDILHNKNEDFQHAVKEMAKINWRITVTQMVNKNLLRFLGFRSARYKLFGYFSDIIQTNIDYRRKNGYFRNDLFQFLMQLTNSEKHKNDKEDLRLMKHHKLNLTQMITQCFAFFLGGYDSSSVLTSFALLEIASNPAIQKKLRENIRTSLKKHGGLTYAAAKDMDYLEWLINETLRLHSPANATTRQCNKTYRIPGTNLIIDPGQKVVVPIFGIHRDPLYYPEPNKFDPERFSPENRSRRHPMTFLPFGDGPRNCIGFRLAMMETKIAIAAVINNFDISINEKTKQPISYSQSTILLTVDGGIWLNLKKLS